MKGVTNVAPKPSIVLENVSATFTSNSDSYSSSFPYSCAIAVSNVTANHLAQVTFSDVQATSGNYAPFCVTGSGTVTVYSKTNVGTITIPSLIIFSYTDTFYTFDATPTSGSTHPITSGGVYDSCAMLNRIQRFTRDQTIEGRLDVVYQTSDTVVRGFTTSSSQVSLFESYNATTKRCTRLRLEATNSGTANLILQLVNTETDTLISTTTIATL